MKQESSYSFFCCYCEEPRKRDRNNQQRRPFEGPNQIYKIDTNSYFSEKLNQQQPNTNNIINIINEPPKEIEKEKESIKPVNIKNDEFEEINTIDSYHTINNKNKKENNLTKKENTINHKKRHKNFLQNDINSFLEKKERKDINIENLSAILKKYDTEKIKNISIQDEQNKLSEKPEDKKAEEIKNISLEKKEITQSKKSSQNKEIMQSKEAIQNQEKNDNIEAIQNKENNNNNSIKINNDINNDIKTDYNVKNNLASNQSSIRMNEKENIVSHAIKRINKLEFEDDISQERLIWNYKSNLNQNIKSSLIKSNNSNNTNQNQEAIKDNNIKLNDNNKNTISNKSQQNEIEEDKNTNPINKIHIENDIACQKEKEEIISKNEMINNKNNISNRSNNNNLKKLKNEIKTTRQQKGNSKISLINNDDNSINSAIELKANLNNIKFDSKRSNKNTEKLIENKDKEPKNEINNNNTTNIEPNKELSEKTDVIESQSFKDNKSINNNLSIKEGVSVKLNYLTEFCPSNIAKEEEKKEEESKTTSIKKESISEEVDDEVGSIDEFNNANDNRSVLSSYIFSSVRPTDSNKSFASSIYGRSDSQELGSNFNEIMSNKGMRIFPVELNNTNNKEIEIRMDTLHRNSKNYFVNLRMKEIKKKKEIISEKEKLIKNNYDSIEKMKKKIENMENEERQYERWIEKEEEENENLIYLLNFLMSVNK